LGSAFPLAGREAGVGQTKKKAHGRPLDMAERVGFEPTEARASTVFKTVSFDHSDTSPKEARRITESFPLFQLDLAFHPVIL
jgi:hypothetical protein